MAVDDPTRTDGAADQAPTKPSPTHGKEQAVRTVLWAVGVTLLSNAANILKQLRDVLESMVQLQALALDHVWLSAVVLSGAIIWGNVLLNTVGVITSCSLPVDGIGSVASADGEGG